MGSLPSGVLVDPITDLEPEPGRIPLQVGTGVIFAYKALTFTLDCLLVPPRFLIGRVFEAYMSFGQCHLTKCLVPKKIEAK